MPTNPMRARRFSGGVMSAIYACATVILAPQIPAKSREMSITTRAVLPDNPEPTAKMT